MTAKPAPPIPREVNLSALEYMPLYLARLSNSKSWLACRRRPELAYYMINMWKRAWHERPAGSLENDEDVLCDASGCTFDQWQDLRDDLLRGWTLCNDGRYYHATLCEFVLEAWAKRQAYTARTAAARTARAAKLHATGIVTSPVTGNVTDNATEPVTASNERKNERKKESLQQRVTRANGQKTPRDAMLDAMTAIRNGEPPADPATAAAIEKLGGFAALRNKTDAALTDAMREFERVYAAVQH